METPYPAVDQLTPEWLTAVLRARGHLDSGRVVGVRPRGGASPAGGGPGFRPDHRLAVSYSHDAPPSVPAQLYFRVGAGVVDSLAGKTAGPGLSPYRAWVPLLRAFWWGRLQPAGEVGLVDAALIDGQDTYDFGGFVDYLGDRLSTARRQIYERVLAALPELLRSRLHEGWGLTLVHDDAHIWNFLLPRDPEEDRVYLVDWEQWGASVGPHDVAYLFGLFWYRERRADGKGPGAALL